MNRRKSRVKLNRGMMKAAAALTAFAAVFAGVLLLLYAWEKGAGRPAAGEPGGSGEPEAEDLVYYQDAWYQPKKGLETILVIGVDQAAEDSALHRDTEYEQSDFLLLAVIDKRAERCTAIHINRDTMGRIRVLDDGTDEFLGTITAQLALAHAYGSSPASRCRNTVEAVSDLLYGVPIDGYIALTMDGVVLLNDLAGGVTLEVMDDLTAIDGELARGETVTLRGRQALSYVQARRGLEDPSNLRRMERQRQYLEALQEKLLLCMEADETFAASALLELSECLVSDCSAEKMSELAERVRGYGAVEYRALAGEAVPGGEFVEFYPDENSAREMVMGLFYERAEDVH